MAFTTYDSFLTGQLDGSHVVDFDTDDINLAVLDNGHTPVRATHEFWDDVSADEVSGTNYTSGGFTLANVSVDVSSNTVSITADNPSQLGQSGSGFSDGRYFVIYKDTGTPSTSPLIAYDNLGADFGNVAGPLTLDISNGILDFNPNP